MRLASGSQSQSTARHASFTRRSICSSGSLIVGLDTHCDDSKSQIVAVSNVGRPAVIGESTDDVLCLRLIRGAGSHVHAPLLSHASSVIRHQPEVGSLKWPGFDEALHGWIFEPRVTHGSGAVRMLIYRLPSDEARVQTRVTNHSNELAATEFFQ